MKTLALLLALSCALPALAQPRNQQDGTWWETMTPDLKLGWVTGYTTAMDSASTNYMVVCLANAPLYEQKFPNISLKDIEQRFCIPGMEEFDYDGISMGQFVEGMNSFYSDYRNKQITLGLAIEYVRDAIKGKPAGELESEVEMWRRCAAAYDAGDTSQMAKACGMGSPKTETPPQK